MQRALSILRRLPLQRFRLVRFIISGGTATLVNFALLYTLTEFAHVWYLLSAAVSVAVGFVVSFILQKFWTFEHGDMERVHIQFMLYTGVGLLNIALNTLFLYALVEYAHLWYLLAQFLCAAALAVMNFFIYRHLIFVHKSDPLP